MSNPDEADQPVALVDPSSDMYEGAELEHSYTPSDEAAVQRHRSAEPDLAVSARHFHRLASAIETDIIPRLLMAYRKDADPSQAADPLSWSPDEAEMERFACWAVDGDLAACEDYVEALRSRGVGLDRILLDLLGPTAARLGRWWEEDRCDFTQVTMGVGQLTFLMHEVARRGVSGRTTPTRRVLLSSPPDEQHSFGVLMVGDFFRLSGWHVSSKPAFSRRGLIDAVASEWFSLVGFSISAQRDVDWLSATVSAVRRASQNEQLKIMVGGLCFLDHPNLVDRVGADFMAANGRDAAFKAEACIHAGTHSLC